jgi:hypothetical protein
MVPRRRRDRAVIEPHLYTLIGKLPVPCLDLLNWAAWMERNHRNRHVGDDVLSGSVDDQRIEIRVSTVFLGLDHRFGDGTPLLFETMVFGGPNAGDTRRYETWDEAETGHAEFLARERAWLHEGERIR